MASPYSVGGLCCLALIASLGPEKVFLPGSAGYNDSIGSYYSGQQQAAHPACIVAPKATEDVSTAVVSLTTTTTSQCHFAIRSGGHTSFVGPSNINGGVTLDLRSLNATDVSADRSSVSIGPGATWDMVYSKLDAMGLSVLGGRVAGVGVGGLTTGGGISYYSPRYGWVCDTVFNFEVVLGNGSIVDANEYHNNELLWALRGGSNNLGVVTRLDMKVFEQGLIWSGSTISPLSTFDDQIQEFVKINSVDEYDEYASLITSLSYAKDLNLTVVANDMKYTKAIEDPPIYQAMLNLPALSKTTKLDTLANLTREIQSTTPNGPQADFREVTFLSTAEALGATFHAWNNSVAAIHEVEGIFWSLSLEPLPPAIYGHHPGSNALGLANRTEALVVALITTQWSNAADNDLVLSTSRTLAEAIKRETVKLGAWDPYIYLNYGAQDQDPIASYGEDSVGRLREIRKKYDPNEVFTRQVPGGFKIPGA